jgi:hypothetical protein
MYLRVRKKSENFFATKVSRFEGITFSDFGELVRELFTRNEENH